MAEKYTLVPTERLNLTQTASTTSAPGNLIIGEMDKLGGDDKLQVDEWLEYFPKRFRERARALIKYIKPKLKLNENMRVVYYDGSIGSNIIDLLRYFVLPKISQSKRPADAVRFALFLKEIGAPTTLVNQDLFLKRNTSPTYLNQNLSNGPSTTHITKGGNKGAGYGSNNRRHSVGAWRWKSF